MTGTLILDFGIEVMKATEEMSEDIVGMSQLRSPYLTKGTISAEIITPSCSRAHLPLVQCGGS